MHAGEWLNFFFNANEIVAVLLPQDKIRSGFGSAI